MKTNINNINNPNNKVSLLSELAAFGVSQSGRKVRSDKGVKRGPNSKCRSDKGLQRTRKESLPVSIYCRVRKRVLNNNLYEDKYCYANDPLIDKNGLFRLITRSGYTKEGYYEIVSHGLAKHRMVKHIAASTVDLEKYRFEALYDLMMRKGNESPDESIFSQEINHTNADCYYELFQRLYHLPYDTLVFWTYEHWKHDYDIVKDTYLESDFTFNFHSAPGTPSFMPEYESVLEENKLARRLEIENSHEYKVLYSKERDKILSKICEQYRQEILNDPLSEGLTQTAISRRVSKRVTNEDRALAEKSAKAAMDIIVEEKLRKEVY